MWDRLKRLFAGGSSSVPARSPTPATAASGRRPTEHSKHPVLPNRVHVTCLHVPRDRQPAFHFLGQGVSHEAAELNTDRPRLNELGLPVIETGVQLATAIGYSPQRLRWLAYHSQHTRSCNYFYFEVTKRSGGQRLLAAPRPQIDACARWIQREILDRIEVHPAAHGFVGGKSIKTNAAEHVGAEVVVNVDLCDFFPTIGFRRVRGLFKSLGYNGQVATLLALLCTEAPREQHASPAGSTWRATGPRHLPQGARTSPTLSNLICRTLDRRLAGICKAVSWNYSRYADDLTFSASAAAANQVGYLLHRVRGIVGDEGFRINEDKTRVQRRSQAQGVTGLVVNQRVAVSRKTIRMLRALLHNASKQGLDAQNRNGLENFEAWLEGLIGHVEHIDPKRGSEFHAKFRQLKSQSQKRT